MRLVKINVNFTLPHGQEECKKNVMEHGSR